MNSNFNTFFQKILPYLFTILFAYILTTIIFIFLPKSGVDFIKSSNSNISYQKYDGFYSKVSIIKSRPKIDRKIEKKDIQTLSRYALKAIYSTASNSGWITIEEKSNKKSIILEQYEKFNGYTLTKLYKNYVLFEKNLKEYKLELPKEKEVSYEIEKKTSSGKEKIIVSGNSVSVNRNYLNSYVKNLDKVWKDIAIKDIRKDGKVEGFKINSINKNSVFGKLGLKQNDVIKSVNGTEIKSYADAFKIYNKINSLEYLSLEILRNNEMMELNYEVN